MVKFIKLKIPQVNEVSQCMQLLESEQSIINNTFSFDAPTTTLNSYY